MRGKRLSGYEPNDAVMDLESDIVALTGWPCKWHPKGYFLIFIGFFNISSPYTYLLIPTYICMLRVVFRFRWHYCVSIRTWHTVDDIGICYFKLGYLCNSVELGLSCSLSMHKAPMTPCIQIYLNELNLSWRSESAIISGVAVNYFPLGHCPWASTCKSGGLGGQGFLFHCLFPTTGVLGQKIDRCHLE